MPTPPTPIPRTCSTSSPNGIISSRPPLSSNPTSGIAMRPLLFLLAFVAAGPLPAAPASYLADSRTDILALLAPPPTAGSAEDKADLAAAYAVASTATPEQVALAKDEVKLTIFHFAPVIGPWFQPGKFPKLEALFKEVEAEAKAVTSKGKKHWQRLRPYIVDPVRFPHAVEHEKPTDYRSEEHTSEL